MNDVFCVKLGVTGEEPLNPTLLGFFPIQPSAGSCWCVSHQCRAGIFIVLTHSPQTTCAQHTLLLKNVGIYLTISIVGVYFGHILDVEMFPQMVRCNTSRENRTNLHSRPQHTHKEIYSIKADSISQNKHTGSSRNGAVHFVGRKMISYSGNLTRPPTVALINVTVALINVTHVAHHNTHRCIKLPCF